jgi:hypothetical protein
MSVYHEVRLPYDATRDVIWRSLWRYYFHQFIGPDDCVLDIGCGHGAFINSVVARKRLGLDSWPDFPAYLQAGVQPVIGSAVEVGELVKEPVDFAFASNLFEHLPQTDLMMLLSGVRGAGPSASSSRISDMLTANTLTTTLMLRSTRT